MSIKQFCSNIFISEEIGDLKYLPSKQRAGIADGGEFNILTPGTAAWLFAKVK